ncbi:DUF5947 family protein [Kutzneria buriramensis]|uniref:Uncharacterized protein n=1 Tax=Kutzneria buriramensis TaxID=1045776 RepID=A0A3E0HMM9_9PSEU|nr:DUF5947 family protein [Kutzneria buriramensis]REH47265.1 hypothetical protein BCF44_106430 [Kutzneria buriramensis]
MTSGLRRFAKRVPTEQVERCEMCARPIAHEHSHVVNTESRAILCACRPCYLLFTHEGAGKHRAIPERYVHVADLAGGRALWESAGIPVRMAFVFTNSELDAPVAFYPSPAGATECLLPLESWTQLLADNPALADLAPDVEALLVCVNSLGQDGDRFEGFLVPIDACYRLVGVVRLNWKGFDGGTEAWREIDAFFADLRERGRHG